jgi:feruloyl esterase
VLFLSPAAGATVCADLGRLALPGAKIDFAGIVAAGAFAPPGARGGGTATAFSALPAFCRVTATLTPTADSDIKTEVWLPVSGWNGKLLTVGNGGWAGAVPYAALAQAVAGGYAGAGTDTGHVGNNADFALGHPEKLIDFAYRSIHETTAKAKTVISAHYGAGPRLSYFSGCSQGGRQALAAAQMYPGDFDGIVAGAASWNLMRAHASRMVLNLTVNKNSSSVIPADKYRMIHEKVLNACDSGDGVKDGLIENPLKCDFDYAKLLCKGTDGADCLTKGQVESAKAMTSPVRDPKTGKVLFEGHLLPGAELGWATLGGTTPIGLSLTAMRNVTFGDRNWDYRTMNASTDVDRAVKSDNGALYSGNPNLKPFFDRGGKLLMYHGWSDPLVTPLNSVNYYNAVVKTVGKEQAANSIALFMAPGMNHCSGGAGPNTFDTVEAIELWVEQGKTPTQIIARHLTNGEVDRTRPLCPYPQVARYKGTGDINDAANFRCVKN